jgi:ABC-type transport system substrate-binding protein
LKTLKIPILSHFSSFYLTQNARRNYHFNWNKSESIHQIRSPDYLDPYNILQKLYDPLSSLNSAQVNDTNLNEMMKLALETTNDDARNIIYKNIQGYMAEQGYYNAPLYQTKIFYVHSADLRNVPYNAMKKFQAYGIWRVL